MEEYDFYVEEITKIAKKKNWEEEELVFFLRGELENKTESIERLVSFRKQLLSDDDYRKSSSYYEVFFPGHDESKTAVLVAIFFEIQKESKSHFHFLSFEKYHPAQPLFQKHPELFQMRRVKSNETKDEELIQLNSVIYTPIPNISTYRACRYKDSFLLINKYLDSRILSYLLKNYSADNISVRIDPYDIRITAPPFTLHEEFLRPPNPYWIKRLILHPYQKEGSIVFLPELSIEDIGEDEWKQAQYREFHHKKLRKLETIASVKNEGETTHFSMMLEELSEEGLSNDFLIGRMIHLDALDTFDTPFQDIRLRHLDLAINVYKGSAIVERQQASLAGGHKVPDATYRTHLIRVDNILFSDLIDICYMFFKSTTMTDEWINKQFELDKQSEINVYPKAVKGDEK